jgi:hypothetical protein
LTSGLNRCLRRIGGSFRGDILRQVKARNTNPIVRHPVVDVEAIWSSKIVAPVDAGSLPINGSRNCPITWPSV